MHKSVAVLALTLVFTVPAWSAPLPSRVSADRETLQSTLDRTAVKARLAAAGLSRQRVEAVLDRLTPQDIHQLATNIEQMQTAGGTAAKVWIGVAVLAVALVLYYQSHPPRYVRF